MTYLYVDNILASLVCTYRYAVVGVVHVHLTRPTRPEGTFQFHALRNRSRTETRVVYNARGLTGISIQHYIHIYYITI